MKKKKWDYHSVRTEALKYNTKNEFQNNSQYPYTLARKNKWIDEICSHMSDGRREYTDKEIIKDALKYESRWKYQKNSNTYYAAKYKGRDFLNKVCNHMRTPSNIESGFRNDKPAILYYLKINNGDVFKIGITNRSVKDRFKNYELDRIEVLKEWKFSVGHDAQIQEQKILNEFAYAKYKGTPILNDGNTELFTHDVLLLDC